MDGEQLYNGEYSITDGENVRGLGVGGRAAKHLPVTFSLSNTGQIVAHPVYYQSRI